MEIRQFTMPSQIMELTDEQMEELWQWAYRTKNPRGMTGINGMPLLSIGRLIEFLIDYGVDLKNYMRILAIEYHEGNQLIDILWDSVKVILKAPVKIIENGKIKYKQRNPGGTMQQWVNRAMWKNLPDSSKLKIYTWAKNGRETRLFNAPSTDFGTRALWDVPMLSIGRLLEFLTDGGMTLREVFDCCVDYNEKEWRKKQLIDVLWEKVSIVSKFSLQTNIIKV